MDQTLAGIGLSLKLNHPRQVISWSKPLIHKVEEGIENGDNVKCTFSSPLRPNLCQFKCGQSGSEENQMRII
jgi:hypothetical protein